MSKRKKGHTEEHENIERWLITYADLITLLLGLFVVLYSMSQIDLNKYQQWISAFSQLFGGGGVLSSGKGILVTPIPPKSSLDAIANSSKPSSQQNLEAQLNAVLSSSIQSKKIMITTSTEGLTIHLLEMVFCFSICFCKSKNLFIKAPTFDA